MAYKTMLIGSPLKDCCQASQVTVLCPEQAAVQDYPTDFQKNCTVVDNYGTRASMVPKKWPTGLPLNGYSLPMDDPPSIPGATCNFAMPDHSTRDRYLWVMPAMACTHASLQ